jgi:hypothetical protein
MKFSKDSEQMMSVMMDDFEKFIKKKSSSQQRTFDRIMKNFYSEVKSADKFTDKLWKDGKVKVNIREIHDFRSIRHTSLLSSTYTPANIKKYIKSNIKGVINYKFSAGGRSITVNFYLMHNSEFNQLIKFDKLVYKMIMWLKMVSSYTRSRCSRTLKVNCYMTPLKKILPNSPFTVLSSNHANTAVTTSCTADGEICLYRKEEIFKVFIHETFHVLGLDFSSMSNTLLNSKVHLIFPISSSYNLYEGYTEFWATIMNCVFTAYYMSKDSRDPNEFYLYAEYCIAFEQFFSLFQCVKVLDFMGLSYHNLHGKDNLSERARKYLYKEETNIFAYYVIKCILLYNFIPFINWCKSNNDNILSFYRSKDNLMRFYRFIMLHYRSKQFNAELDRVQKVLKLHKSNVADNDNKIIAKTMRMTIIELL